MATFCIPKKFVEELKKSALNKEINIENLYNMTSRERRDFFSKYTNPELSKLINTEFEKAMVSQKQNALLEWAQGVFSPKEKAKPMFKNVLDKINSLSEQKALTPESEEKFLEDLVADKLGIYVSPEEVAKINQLAADVQLQQEKLAGNIGSLDHIKENVNFFKARKKIDDYLAEISPTNKLKVWTGTIGRSAMLASLKSPLLNIESNTVAGIFDAITRRVEQLNLGIPKADQLKIMKDYMKMANKIYQETGYDISRMTNINDTGVAGERVLGMDTVHSKGAGGATEKIGGFAEDVVFKQMLGAPDVAFSTAHFIDSVLVNAKKIAKNSDIKMEDLMKDATRIQPMTKQGEALRAQAIADAQYATYTNESWASKVSLGIRKIINDISGDLRLGDWFMPFVKTPANVVAFSAETGGAGIPKALYDLGKAMVKGTSKKEAVQKNARDLIRAGLGMTAAALLANSMEDFSGEYDPRKQQINELKNIPGNAVKIHGNWYSLDFFGPLAAPLTGMLYAKKYAQGKGALEKGYQYGSGLVSQIKKMPGVDLAASATGAGYQKVGSSADKIKTAGGQLLSDISARLIPSIVSDIAAGTDTVQRDTQKSTVKAIQAKIPGARQLLASKKDVFGEDIPTNSFLTQLTMGSSRFRKDRGDTVINELYRLDQSGNPVNITDFRKSTSKTIENMRESLSPEDFKSESEKYGQELKSKLDALISSQRYQAAEDIDREKMVRTAMSRIVDKYTMKYKRSVKR